MRQLLIIGENLKHCPKKICRNEINKKCRLSVSPIRFETDKKEAVN